MVFLLITSACHVTMHGGGGCSGKDEVPVRITALRGLKSCEVTRSDLVLVIVNGCE